MGKLSFSASAVAVKLAEGFIIGSSFPPRPAKRRQLPSAVGSTKQVVDPAFGMTKATEVGSSFSGVVASRHALNSPGRIVFSTSKAVEAAAMEERTTELTPSQPMITSNGSLLILFARLRNLPSRSQDSILCSNLTDSLPSTSRFTRSSRRAAHRSD